MSARGTTTAREQDVLGEVPAWARGIGLLLAHGVWASRVVGREHVPSDGPVVLAANHVSIVDGPLLQGVTPRRVNILVKEEMFAGPVGGILRASRQIPVDRSGGRAALVSALGVLQRGGAVGVFPEGNRGRGDAASARAGVAWLAVNGHAPVVPVAILGTRRTGESVGHVPGFRRRLHVEIGEPLHLDAVEGQPRREAIATGTEQVRLALSALVARASVRTRVMLPRD
ncbi:lysophospholipid acyltransferase family protein [Cellulomonas triticagri]|uniref:1-acyl-sn-glycerol-3-phosphate acyltransferase n=1 Tax=Cellulomonas triticagri TaxID=2483352 RepID=A0A3M2J249_9CELL|nr:lysophospholipid acyltransferase family protein [Cellulomonas triticagri]RMI06884.1 1-acyl-sn-glycerol-3-phosphate acyltransferase [Cellulomonas triticagri]